MKGVEGSRYIQIKQSNLQLKVNTALKEEENLGLDLYEIEVS